MRTLFTLGFYLLACASIVISPALHADSPPAPPPAEDVGLAEQVKALQQLVQGLQESMTSQQGQIDALKSENAALQEQLKSLPAPAPESVSTAAQPSPAPAAMPPGAPQSALPEIGGLVDIVGTSSQRRDDEEGNDRLSLRELELTLGHDIDPYTRFDATITFSDFEDADVEEAYISYLGLPYQLSLRGGRFRPKIGKASVVHRDQLDTVDEPLVVQRYLGVEGLFKTGVEVSRFLPSFADPLTQELTVGVIEGGSGEDGQMFGDTRRRPTIYAHLKNYWEMSDTSSVELGATFLRGSDDSDALDEVNALGVDLTVLHHFNSVNRLKWQSEMYLQDRRERRVRSNELLLTYVEAFGEDFGRFTGNIAALAGGDAPEFGSPALWGARGEGAVYTRYNENPLGLYSVLDFRISPRFGVGVRYDYVEPVTYSPWVGQDPEHGLNAYLTFYQSEFARLRLQYQHLEAATGDGDNIVYVQGTYAFGIHKHVLK